MLSVQKSPAPLSHAQSPPGNDDESKKRTFSEIDGGLMLLSSLPSIDMGDLQNTGPSSKHQRLSIGPEVNGILGMGGPPRPEDHSWSQVGSALITDTTLSGSKAQADYHKMAPSFSFDHSFILGSTSLDIMASLAQNIISVESLDEFVASPVMHDKRQALSNRHRRSMQAPSRDFLDFFHGPGISGPPTSGGMGLSMGMSHRHGGMGMGMEGMGMGMGLRTSLVEDPGHILKVSSEDWQEPWHRVNSLEHDELLPLNFHSTSNDEGGIDSLRGVDMFFEKSALQFKSRSDSNEVDDTRMLTTINTVANGAPSVGVATRSALKPNLRKREEVKPSKPAAITKPPPPPPLTWDDFPDLDDGAGTRLLNNPQSQAAIDLAVGKAAAAVDPQVSAVGESISATGVFSSPAPTSTPRNF